MVRKKVEIDVKGRKEKGQQLEEEYRFEEKVFLFCFVFSFLLTVYGWGKMMNSDRQGPMICILCYSKNQFNLLVEPLLAIIFEILCNTKDSHKNWQIASG